MNIIRTCFCLSVIFALVTVNQCRRSGGGGGSRGGGYSRSGGSSRGGSSSHGGSSHVYRPSPTVGRTYTSPPVHRNDHPYQRVTTRPVYNPVTPRRSSPTSPRFTTARSIYQQPTQYHPHTTARSIQKVTSRPINQQPTQYHPHTTVRPIQRVTSRPINQQPTQRPRTTPRPHTTPRRITTPRSYTVGSTNRWALPPRPEQQRQYHPQGSTQHGYPQSYTGYHGPSKIKIVNKYKYNYPGYHSLPVYSSYPGYYHAPSYYRYSSGDTGSTALGFFMGYGLGRLTTPTYSHYSFYNGYTPRYDHYTVHHYYHNRESIPPKQEIPSNTIVGCVGDSSTVCPNNTVSLCTSSGALMCVVTAAATTPCTNNVEGQCVTTVIPCVNNEAPECKNSKDNTTTVSVPCISTAEVHGDIKYVDNTIIMNVPENSTQTNNSTTTTVEWSTKYPITTTPLPPTTTITTANETVRKRRDTAQNFCVTVVALPAEKKETAGEKLYDDAKDIISKFMENVWGL